MKSFLALRHVDVEALRGPIVYVWIRGAEVLYVGMSTNGLVRPLGRQHEQLKGLEGRDTLLIWPHPKPEHLENALIYHLRPCLNRAPVKCPTCVMATDNKTRCCSNPPHAPDPSFFGVWCVHTHAGARQMECPSCGVTFAPKHPRGRFCSSKCRSQAWRAALRKEELEAFGQIERGVEKLRKLSERRT